MKKLTKKFAAIVIALLVVSAISASSLVAMASVDEEIDFRFSFISDETVNRGDDRRYRSTSDNNNAWKVDLQTSNETTDAKECGSLFCIGLEDATLASAWQLVVRYSGPHYYATNDAADFRYVYLMCKDNNNSGKPITLTGVWDEETGRAPN